MLKAADAGVDMILPVDVVCAKEFANDSYYSFHYYTKEFILSFYGSPIYCITISDMNKGCILYTTQGIDLSTVRE